MRKMEKVPISLGKQGSEEIPQSENAENAQNADMKTRKIQCHAKGAQQRGA